MWVETGEEHQILSSSKLMANVNRMCANVGCEDVLLVSTLKCDLQQCAMGYTLKCGGNGLCGEVSVNAGMRLW